MTLINENAVLNKTFPIEYLIIDGEKVVILNRIKGFILAHACPFCGFNHSFPPGEGLQKTRCPNTLDDINEYHEPTREPIRYSVIAADGSLVHSVDGYFIKEYDRGN